jgi:hypothetical protein
MTMAATSRELSALYAPGGMIGESPTAHEVDAALRAILEADNQRAAFAELRAACGQARAAGWDGEGSLPVTQAAFETARAFLTPLLVSFPDPEVGVDSDGEISFDWVFGPGRALTLSIAGSGRISYAWMNGPRRGRGTEWFDGRVPRTIALALAELARPHRAAGVCRD